ncbi:hypothetical protein B0I72DRAFT_164728 [Yarrowia lipolytica]|uniref:YALI0A00198p n=1 Tax=Yarrowia lipolytica (strain CLIB 122 / E 150) TaxID=284591 RepID=Q6CIA4_YARLI|nr:YALI0A00198p [Yarrowia lipolytica CLIB122]RDW32466.1 hypothetical protein B0I72DRAFT_164728 [Yarrowia lipolytica]CAG83527.1 YALI0A00198p [Yarrowia lipolytica CLIB122]|eukprot:XP_499607.1 YALI0A00198p [Yarrowia lipolytica CLIB122]
MLNNEEDTQQQLTHTLLPALMANWFSMILRHGVMLSGLTVTIYRLQNQNLSPGEQGRRVMELVACLAAGILPLWTPPKISAAQLHLFQVSPYIFTAAILLASTLLLGVCQCWLLSVHPAAFVLVLLLNSFLVNEIKWSEAFFASNWLPESQYYETIEKSKQLTILSTLISSGLVALFKTAWFYLVLFAAVLYVSYMMAFVVDARLENQTKYKQMLEESEDFAPLQEWNDDHSSGVYAVIRERNWAAWGVYYFFQYL